MKVTRSRVLKTGATFSVGLIILLVLIRQVGFEEAYSALQKADLTFVFLGMLASLFSLFLAGIRWRVILNDKYMSVDVKSLYLSLLSGAFVNNITPAGKGSGEPLRAYLLSKFTGLDGGKVFATVISDRIFDTLPYVLLGYFGIIEIAFFWNVPRAVVVTLSVALVFLTAILAIVFYLLFNIEHGKKLVMRILGIIGRFMPDKVQKYEEKLEDTLELFNKTIREIAHNRKKVIYATTLSLFIWAFWILRTYLVFLAFDTTVSFTVLAVVAVVASFMGMVPFSPGGFGTTEGAMILLFSGFGIESSIAVGVTLVDRVLSYWLPIVLGGLTLGVSHRVISRNKNTAVKM